jgi:hypothetical protein
MEISNQLQVPAALLLGKESRYVEQEAEWPSEHAGRGDKENSPCRILSLDTLFIFKDFLS